MKIIKYCVPFFRWAQMPSSNKLYIWLITGSQKGMRWRTRPPWHDYICTEEQKLSVHSQTTLLLSLGKTCLDCTYHCRHAWHRENFKKSTKLFKGNRSVSCIYCLHLSAQSYGGWKQYRWRKNLIAEENLQWTRCYVQRRHEWKGNWSTYVWPVRCVQGSGICKYFYPLHLQNVRWCKIAVWRRCSNKWTKIIPFNL